MRCFRSEFALDLLNKIHIADRDRLRLTSVGSNRSSGSIAALGSNRFKNGFGNSSVTPVTTPCSMRLLKIRNAIESTQ